MSRGLNSISRREYDLIVVGGGIYGAWAALDAAQRGLSVALLEKADFGHATSSNHHRIIHGGLRYLQHGDLHRMRNSIRERSILLRNAPELVRPMPVLAPTSRRWNQHRLVMAAALMVNDLISLDRNRGLSPERSLPRGTLISTEACAQLAPMIDFSAATGGALFHDAQVLSPERLIISIIKKARALGADVANYTRVTACLRTRRGTQKSLRRVHGVQVLDVLTGSTAEIRGRMILNCAGPWAASQMRLLDRSLGHDVRTFKAAVLITRDPGLKTAVAIPGAQRYHDAAEVLKKGYRNYFLTPWRGLAIIGTFYAPYDGSADDCTPAESEIAQWLDELNAACPTLGLERHDVYRAMSGLLPRARAGGDDLQYAKHPSIIDHGRQHGIEGAISVIGVKFTTARSVAERAVDLAAGHIGRPAKPCRTHDTPLNCDPVVSDDVCRASAELQAEPARLRAMVLRAVREEHARTLADVIFRRTDLGLIGAPPLACLAMCAQTMREHLGWDLLRTEREIQFVRSACGEGGFVHAA